ISLTLHPAQTAHTTSALLKVLLCPATGSARNKPAILASSCRWAPGTTTRPWKSIGSSAEKCRAEGGSGPPEKVFHEFWKPSRGRLGARRGRKLLDDHKAVDFSFQVGVEEGRVVAEGHASVRLAVGTEHVGMCK